MDNPKNVMGVDGFYWFMGVVECTSDPEKLGRVKVRVLGDHTQNKNDIPTSALPWAMPMMPVTTASMNGIGHAPIGLVQGSWVMGFYRDGQDKQQPIIMGSIGGIPIDSSSPATGFNDPIGCFPQESKLSEPDTNRHARGTVGKHVDEPVPVTIRKASVLKGVTTAATQWSEPESPYAPVYPYNYVWEGFYNPECDSCEWGHIEEWDSTPGSERYFRQHKTSQNFLEIHPDGKEVRKIFGDGFEIDLANKHLYVEGDYRVTISGNKDEHIKGDYWQHIEGDMIRVVDGNKATITRGNDSMTVYSDIVRRSKGSTTDATENNHVRLANNDIKDSAGGKVSVISSIETTCGVGSYSPISIENISPVFVTSDGYKSIALSCSVINTGKISTEGSIIPSIPNYNVNASGTASTQLKVTPGTIFVDASSIQNTGPTVVNGKLSSTGGISSAGDVSSSGSMRVAGNILASGPVGTDTDSGHTYLAVTASPSPSPPSSAVSTSKSSISSSTSIGDLSYTATDITNTPASPGEIHKCE
jgi:hypothetical protein